MVAMGSQSLGRVRPLVCTEARKIKMRCKFCAHAQHVQCRSQVNFLDSILMAMSRCANVVGLVSLTQKVHQVGGSDV